VVAALGDLQVREVPRRRDRARRIGIERATRRLGAREPRLALAVARERVTRRGDDLVPLARAEHGIDLGEVVEQPLPRALREAAGDDEPTQPAGALELGDTRDRVTRFAHRAAEERARVDDRDVGGFDVAHRAEAVTHEQAEHVFRVDGVLWATERDERERRGFGTGHAPKRSSTQ
jgi:hypothetical protein